MGYSTSRPTEIGIDDPVTRYRPWSINYPDPLTTSSKDEPMTNPTREELLKVCDEVLRDYYPMEFKDDTNPTMVATKLKSMLTERESQSPLGDVSDVIAEYDRITATLDPQDAEEDFVMRGSDWRAIRVMLTEREGWVKIKVVRRVIEQERSAAFYNNGGYHNGKHQGENTGAEIMPNKNMEIYLEAFDDVLEIIDEIAAAPKQEV